MNKDKEILTKMNEDKEYRSKVLINLNADLRHFHKMSAINEGQISPNDYKLAVVSLEIENKELQAKVDQLETNRDEAIEYIKHSWRLKFDQVYDTSKYLSGWEAEELLSILERGKE